MDKGYFEILGKCVELSNFVENYGSLIESTKFKYFYDDIEFPPVSPEEKKKREKKRETELKRMFKKFNSMVRKIDRMIEKAHKEGKNYPVVNIITRYELDPIERILFYFALGEKIIGRETWHLSNLLLFITKGDSVKFTELKIKYLQPNSKIIKQDIISLPTPNVVVISKRRYAEICGDKEFQVFHQQNNQNTQNIREISGPEEIYSFLSKKVIGQEEAKQVLSIVGFQHYQRIKGENKVKKSNVMLIGPTGVGKTYLVRTLAEYLDIPVVFCSATEFTETGYVGKSVSDILGDLAKEVNWDISKAEKGIVFIDEIDKIATCNSIFPHRANRDVSGRSVQEELLDLLENSGKRTFIYGIFNEVTMDVSNILFIAAGACEGLKEIQEKRMKEKGIGFHISQENKELFNGQKVEIDDLIEYGLIPELVGRFSHIVTLHPLNVNHLIEIMVNTEDSVLKEYQEYFKQFGIELEVKPSVIEKIAYMAYERGTGARSLRSIFESILRPYLFKINEISKNGSCIIIDEGIFNIAFNTINL